MHVNFSVGVFFIHLFLPWLPGWESPRLRRTLWLYGSRKPVGGEVLQLIRRKRHGMDMSAVFGFVWLVRKVKDRDIHMNGMFYSLPQVPWGLLLLRYVLSYPLGQATYALLIPLLIPGLIMATVFAYLATFIRCFVVCSAYHSHQ
ncbi:hypothetical protein F4782DRAFT_494710 [Xylaria castorea]|nr:hypothetical protein F4782DRAFT_494710 [Xylaria castorea]